MKHHLDAIRRVALAYPEAYEESPWGELAIKVRKKVFVFLGAGDAHFSLSLKLPESKGDALQHDWAQPTGYGLGRHGWVSCRFEGDVDVPVEQLLDWMHESYCTVAPKRLVKTLPMDVPRPPMPEAEAPEPQTPTDGPLVLLVGDDPLRLERAEKALSRAGLACGTAGLQDAVDMAGDAQPAVIVVDVSRNASQAPPIAAELAAVCWDARLVVAGIRNPKMEASVRDAVPKAHLLSREPPGDPGLVAAIVEAVPE